MLSFFFGLGRLVVCSSTTDGRGYNSIIDSWTTKSLQDSLQDNTNFSTLSVFDFYFVNSQIHFKFHVSTVLFILNKNLPNTSKLSWSGSTWEANHTSSNSNCLASRSVFVFSAKIQVIRCMIILSNISNKHISNKQLLILELVQSSRQSSFYCWYEKNAKNTKITWHIS